MQITINGEVRECAEKISVQRLVELEKLEGVNIAIAIGKRVIPKAEWSKTELSEGDSVTIIKASYGG